MASRYGRCSRRRHFHVAWNPPPSRARDCPSLPLRVATLSLKLSRSEVPGPPVLLSYYVTCVISRGPGVLSSLSPFLGCLSGSSELDWGSVELLRPYEERVLWFRRRSSSWPLPRLSLLGCSMLCLFMALIPGVSFSFVPGFVAKIQGPPHLLLGLRASLYRPTQTRDNRNVRLLYPVRAVRCSLVRLGCASSAMQAVPFCRRV